MLSIFLKTKKYFRLEKTKVLMVDKDFNEINCLKEVFTKAKVLLCMFHVLKYIKGKVQDLEILYVHLVSVERILEVELYCDCRMPELKTSYF